MTAKLLHSWLLCNDINLRTLVDIVTYDQEHILITCRSFIKRFNLNTKKQVNSWLLKSWHVLTTGAVKVPQKDEICSIINDHMIWVWQIQEKDTENVEKHKFKSPMKAVVSCQNILYILYTNGYVESFESGLKKRKLDKESVIKANENILQYHVDEEKEMVVLLIKNEDEDIFVYKTNIGSSQPISYTRLKLMGFNLTGSTISSHGTLLTTWSDGSLYSLDVCRNDLPTNPGTCKGKLTPLNKNKSIKIFCLSPTHVALQGMKHNEEGGLVVLWDIKFCVAVSSKPLKMYRDPPLAWSVNSGVVVGDGMALVYIPVNLEPSTVASMFGSRIGESTEYHEEIVGWDLSAESSNKGKLEGSDTLKTENQKIIPVDAIETILSNKSAELGDLIRRMHKGSTSEEVIADLTVHHLIKQNNLKLILECLSEFSFLSERTLIIILKYLIDLPDESFSHISENNSKDKKNESPKKKKKSPKKGGREGKHELVNTPSNGLEKDESCNQGMHPVFSPKKASSVNQVLLKSFTAWELAKSLRILDFKSSLMLLEHLHYLLATGEAPMSKGTSVDVPTVEMASSWFSLLLDTNYHQLVMTSEVEIHRKLLTCLSDLTLLEEALEQSWGLDTLVKTVLNSKALPKPQADNIYSIERLVI